MAGKYTQTTCPDSPAADQKCFQGTLDILQGSAQDFLMTQTCADPYHCTVTTSSFAPITAGTELTYTPCVTITVPDGSTTGTCDLNQPAPVIGRFTFTGGTGVFDQFHLSADATVAGDRYAAGAVWTWTGTYWFGNGQATGTTQGAVVRCALTPDAAASATVQWNRTVEPEALTVKAGQAVAFITQSDLGGVTVTEGMNGTPAENACIDQELVYQTPLLVTFYKLGVYNVFCRKAPSEMNAVVTVQ